eukprot:scaffold108639_cov56-Phaeocystis_antarctica.AAC.2
MARSRHARQRLPAVGLRVVHLRFSKRVRAIVIPAHDIELAAQNRSAVSAALGGHAGDLAPRIEQRVVGPHRPGTKAILLRPFLVSAHQLLEAAKRRLHGGLLESRQGEGLGDPPHLERVVGRELGGHHSRARRLKRLDHQPCRRVQQLGQLALLDLAGALVQKGQHRLEHGRAHALER